MGEHMHKVDPGHKKEMGKKVGIVGESHIWDGPLNQEGRPHGKGSSSGAYGMKLKQSAVPFNGLGPITQKAKG